MLLEDDDVDAELLHRLLSQAWCDGEIELTMFSLVADFEEGIKTLEPDVVFCDMSLPDGRGLTVVERAVQAAGLTPVVVLTSNADPAAPELALGVGAQDYLSKGQFDSETLARTLRHSIARTAAIREVQRIDRDLLQLNAELDQYTGIVAHDLRAPLRTARLFADRLIAAATEGEDVIPMGTALDSSLDRMERLVARLLTMASLRDEVLHPVRESTRLIIADVESDLSADIETTRAAIEYLSEDADDSVTADSVLIRELMGNLLQNSINYRRPDQSPVIKIWVRQVGLETEIQVADNGVGIPDRFRDRVFRLFERLESDTDPTGMGFGLAFCRRVAELHQGSIHIAPSPEAEGTRVIVRLPQATGPGHLQARLN
ncbi:MAG: sensor histidine kinase [Acidimicrobiales bacterium]